MTALLVMALANAAVASALAGLLVFVERLWRRPAVISILWLIVLLKFITPPFLTVPTYSPIGLSASAIAPAEIQVAIDGANQRPADEPPHSTGESTPAQRNEWQWPEALSQVVLFVWMAGAVGCLAWTAQRTYFVHRQLRWAQPAPQRLQMRVGRLARRLGMEIARSPSVNLLAGRFPPMVWPLWIARVILPVQLCDCLTSHQLASAIMHELAHIWRRDHLLWPVHVAVTAIYWWNPLAWMAVRRHRAAQDECCDAWVVSMLPTGRRDLAEALCEVWEFLSLAPEVRMPAACHIGRSDERRREQRLALIRKGETSSTLSRNVLRIVLALGAVALATGPGWGDDKQRILFEDALDGGRLDTQEWRPPPREIIKNGGLKVEDGFVRLVNRGYLATRREFAGPLSVRLDWKWMQMGLDPYYLDSLAVALHTSGTPDPKRSFEASDGIHVAFDATSGTVKVIAPQGQAIPGPKATIVAATKAGAVRLMPERWLSIRIDDDTESLKIYMRGAGGRAEGEQLILETPYKIEAAAHHIAIYNRELAARVPHESAVRRFAVMSLPKARR